MTALGLHNLQVARGSKKGKKRLGRGNASGKGNQSGRGGKGQRARSGGKAGLVLFGVKTYLQRIPKSRGFKSLRYKTAEINVGDLNKNFNDGGTVTPAILERKGLIFTGKYGLKVLGSGELNKKLNVTASGFSKKAEEAIIKAGGSVLKIGKNKESASEATTKSE